MEEVIDLTGDVDSESLGLTPDGHKVEVCAIPAHACKHEHFVHDRPDSDIDSSGSEHSSPKMSKVQVSLLLFLVFMCVVQCLQRD
jgi:hypothetical protein